jgi:hypothetical protein
MKHVLAAAMLLALAACGPSGNSGAPMEASKSEAYGGAGMARDAVTAAAPEAPAAEAAADMDAPAPVAPPGQPPGPNQPGTPPGAVLLAYAYAYGVEVPAKEVPATMKLHEKVCADAGPTVCQVLGAATNAYGEDDVRGSLNIRAEPKWLKTFRERLEVDAEKAGGKLTSSQVSSEDLTRAIVDTEANLRAQRTLRDRLQNLLASRPGKLGELLEVERELARVQGEVDSIESNLAVMRTRVSMSVLTIDYQSSGKPLTDTTFEPLGHAFQDFLRHVVEGFAWMITFVAVVLPWALLAWGVSFLWLRWRRKVRATKEAKQAAAPPAI